MINTFIRAVDPAKAYRLINHGPATLVSARHEGTENVMAASWVCALDYAPPRLTVVLDKAAFTRQLIEQSRCFVIQVPVASQASLVYQLGSHSKYTDPDKLKHSGVSLFNMPETNAPLVSGCAAWLYCELIPEEHNHQNYDLFIGEIKAAWADSRVFRDGHWLFEHLPADWRSLHYIAGGHFYTTGDVLEIPGVTALTPGAPQG
ncbi:flavin reductase family protein [Pectobacterium versatile]|uniref:flavin reductase family protein n=1 Tax=Pectobacterium versatile TaxID=2488639 RepID=UPI001CF1CED0|nr:flavin reductase family protein [Pectobacterium versatile]MCA6924634.1 flavin reductase family protein [Pectobacterium versatile]